LSQTRVRLRALASLGLSIILFGALVPQASASNLATSVPVAIVAPAAMRIPAELSAESAATAAIAPAGTIQRTSLDDTVLAVAAPAPARTRARATAPARSPRAATRPAPRRASTPASRAAGLASTRIIALAESHIGARYEHGATGPHAFDCSGLVYRVFEDAGLGRMIAGLRSASALYAHFRARHMTSTSNPQPGDLVIFGGGSHVGIYIGGGRVVHAMVSGVAITRISAVYPRFTTYVHLGLSQLRLAAH
jgi:cell wall-associated NlpC family hydrolase